MIPPSASLFNTITNAMKKEKNGVKAERIMNVRILVDIFQ